MRVRLKVRLYDASPSVQMYRCDNKAFISFFPIDQSTYDAQQIETLMNTPIGDFVQGRFEELWNAPGTVKLREVTSMPLRLSRSGSRARPVRGALRAPRRRALRHRSPAAAPHHPLRHRHPAGPAGRRGTPPTGSTRPTRRSRPPTTGSMMLFRAKYGLDLAPPTGNDDPMIISLIPDTATHDVAVADEARRASGASAILGSWRHRTRPNRSGSAGSSTLTGRSFHSPYGAEALRRFAAQLGRAGARHGAARRRPLPAAPLRPAAGHRGRTDGRLRRPGARGVPAGHQPALPRPGPPVRADAGARRPGAAPPRRRSTSGWPSRCGRWVTGRSGCTRSASSPAAATPACPPPRVATATGISSSACTCSPAATASAVSRSWSWPTAPLERFTLGQPLDCVIVEDAAVWHEVTPIRAAPGAAEGVRDMLLVDLNPYPACSHPDAAEP